MEPACRRAAGGLLALHCVDLSFDLSRRRRRITRSWSLATGTELAWPGMHPPLVAPGTGPLRGTLPGDAGHLGRVRSTLPSPAWCPSLSGAWHPDRAFGRLGRGPLPLVCGSCAPDGAPHSMQERRKQGSCPPALKRGATHHPTPHSPTGTALHCYSCQDQGNNEGTIKREVQTMRIGDAVFCGAPGEYFVEWGFEIKKWSPFKYTFIAELCDDAVGYIPTYEAFMRGGYEATPVVSVRSTPALGQMIADANFRNLRKL